MSERIVIYPEKLEAALRYRINFRKLAILAAESSRLHEKIEFDDKLGYSLEFRGTKTAKLIPHTRTNIIAAIAGPSATALAFGFAAATGGGSASLFLVGFGSALGTSSIALGYAEAHFAYRQKRERLLRESSPRVDAKQLERSNELDSEVKELERELADSEKAFGHYVVETDPTEFYRLASDIVRESITVSRKSLSLDTPAVSDGSTGALL